MEHMEMWKVSVNQGYRYLQNDCTTVL